MLQNVMTWGIYTFEALFFAGLAGCAIVVAMCWVRIGRESLTQRD